MKVTIIGITEYNKVTPGNHFIYGETVAFKTEYHSNDTPDCYILGSGERFSPPPNLDIIVIEIEISFKVDEDDKERSSTSTL